MSDKICFFGGSFDPIHKGHLKIAEAAYKQMGFDKVVFCPVVCSPHKDNTMFSFRERLDIITSAIKDFGFNSWAEVSDIELNNPDGYTSDLIGIIRKKFNVSDKIYWIVGADQFSKLETWNNYPYLIDNLHFCVYGRDGKSINVPENVSATMLKGEDYGISSSMIREQIIIGELDNNLRLPCYDFFIKGLEMNSFIQRMIKDGITISTAESCTAGNIAGTIANGVGASDVLKCGFITYSNESKVSLLGVRQEIIDTFGVVSSPVAEQMAKGARTKANTTIGISITGYAEPLLAYIGISHEKGTVVHKIEEDGNIHSRNTNRNYLVDRALELTRLFVNNISKN
ncbi:MAG: nicotinate (nicotinamide) nucleotide adenylyltransferase [Paludibacteraceae bacterium]|nr:nicotinate (nicotinamide) nucleotide adenylyltransferase [Paludibacteraceae bacterium]